MHEMGPFEIAMRHEKGPPAHLVAVLAERQHGVVAHRQLRACGMSPSAIQRDIEAGRLHRLHVGVYAVGHPRITGNGRWMAAVLACGNDALLSHRTAAALWNLLPSSSPIVHVTAPRSRKPRPGIVLHRSRRIEGGDRVVHDGIPVTSIARTLIDLAGAVPKKKLRRAVEQAEQFGLFDLRSLQGRMAGVSGASALREVLEDYTRPPPERSELERRFVDFCREAGLPLPEVNVYVGEFLVDAIWREHRLVVELDSWTHHRTRTSFEEDRRRDAALQLMGYRILRITDRRLEHEPAAVRESLRILLDRV